MGQEEGEYLIDMVTRFKLVLNRRKGELTPNFTKLGQSRAVIFRHWARFAKPGEIESDAALQRFSAERSTDVVLGLCGFQFNIAKWTWHSKERTARHVSGSTSAIHGRSNFVKNSHHSSVLFSHCVPPLISEAYYGTQGSEKLLKTIFHATAFCLRTFRC